MTKCVSARCQVGAEYGKTKALSRAVINSK